MLLAYPAALGVLPGFRSLFVSRELVIASGRDHLRTGAAPDVTLLGEVRDGLGVVLRRLLRRGVRPGALLVLSGQLRLRDLVAYVVQGHFRCRFLGRGDRLWFFGWLRLGMGVFVAH